MDAVGTAVGVASFGIQICDGLLSYYDGWKDYHTDISSTYASITDLTQIFTVLKSVLKESETSHKGESVTRVERCLDSCIEGLYRLQSRLSKLQSHGKPQDLRQKTWAELQRAWYPFRAKTLVKLKRDVGELQDRLSLALQALQQITVDHGLSRMIDMMLKLLSNQQVSENRASEMLVNQQSAMSKIQDVLSVQQNILSVQQAAERRAIIDWLSPPDPYYNHNAARERHEPDTGTWLLESNQYKQWKASANNLLWLTGKAGSGKTVLCSTVIEDMRTLPDTRLAFFYFSFSDVQKQSYAKFLSSLIEQLTQGDAAFGELQQAYNKNFSSKPSTKVLEGVLRACFQQLGQKVLLIDALDEVPESERNDGRPAVFEWLRRIMQDDSQTKVFVTSRELPDIQTSIELLGARCVPLRPEFADRDIQKYVAAEIEKHPKLGKFNANMKEKIKEVFKQKADGMFRWAFCQLEILKSLKSTKPKFIEKALYNLPRTLDETYERMLLQIDEMYWDEALTALRWLSFETRPLTLRELAEACLITYEDENNLVDVDNRGPMNEILEILAGLVLVQDMQHHDDEEGDEEPDIRINDTNSELSLRLDAGQEAGSFNIERVSPSSRVRLAHFSVKEYLLSSRILDGRAAPFALKQDDDHPILAQSCLAYLLYYSKSPSKTASKQDFNTFPLLQYAAEAWCTFIPKHKSIQPAYVGRLIQSETSRHDWLSIYDPDDISGKPFEHSRSSEASALYYASLIGIVPLCHVLIDQGADINARGGWLDNPLQAASVSNHLEVVRLLLDRGADVGIEGGEYGNALLVASAQGYRELAQLLLDRGADVQSAGHTWNSALQVASAHGHLEVVQLLLDRGADIEAQGSGEYGDGSNALHAAAVQDHQAVVQLLLDRGANINAHGGMHGNALQGALAEGSQRVVKLLLDRGADVHSRYGGYFGNTLQAASIGGFPEVVQLLLDEGVDPNDAQTALYGDALQAASTLGSREIVQLLIDEGADINAAQRGFFGYPLQAASAQGHREIVQLLLDAGADVNAQGGHYSTALEAATEEEHQEVVQLLLEAGADPGATERYYALQRASLEDDEETMQQL